MTLYADLLRYPDLFGNLFRRELNARYKGSLLGVGWTFVNPLVLMGVYTLVFSVLWRSAGISHYPLFILLSRTLRPITALPSLAALIAACALLMPAALVVGGIFFVLVERPCMDPLWFECVLARLRLAVRRWQPIHADDVIRIPDSAVVDTELPLRSVELVDG